MDTERSQKKGSLDELAARLAARHEQELRELKAAEKRKREGQAQLPKHVHIEQEDAKKRRREREKPGKTSQYSDEETDAQMRVNSGWGFCSALTADDEAKNKARLRAQLAFIWIAIGALTWFFAAPQTYASPALFVVNILIRPQLAAMAGLIMLAAVWLSLDMLLNPGRDADGVTFAVSAGCAYGLAYLCGILLPFPGMEEVLCGYIGVYLVAVLFSPILALLAIIFPPILIVFAPIFLFHHLVDKIIIKTCRPVRSAPSRHDRS